MKDPPAFPDPSSLGRDVERAGQRPRSDTLAAPQRMTRRVVTRNHAAILPFRFSMPEGWPSGLRRTLGKRVYGKPYRGFESHSLRHRAVRICSLMFGKTPLKQ